MHATPSPTTILYDGSHPIFSPELSDLKTVDSVCEICWVDVFALTFLGPPGPSKNVLMQRFHVVEPNGEMASGVAAFVHLWEQLPRCRGLARWARIPFVLNVLKFQPTTF